jgi:hypothetical protein
MLHMISLAFMEYKERRLRPREISIRHTFHSDIEVTY